MKPDKNHVTAMVGATDAKLDELTRLAPAPGADPDAPPGTDAPDAPDQGDRPKSVEMTPEGEARAVLDVVLSLALPFYPALEEVYTDDAKAKIAAAAGPVMAKYNWTLDKFLARWMAEINLAFVALPVLSRTVIVVRAANAEKKATKKPEQEKKPEQLPAAPEPVGANAPVTAGST